MTNLYRRARKAFERHTRQLERQAKQLDQLAVDVAALQKRLKPIELASNHREIEHGRLSMQVGAFEEQLNRLEQRLESGTFMVDDEDQAQARSLVEEVRREHQQVRVRMQIVSQYEERLRRVERALIGLHHGDSKYPV